MKDNEAIMTTADRAVKRDFYFVPNIHPSEHLDATGIIIQNHQNIFFFSSTKIIKLHCIFKLNVMLKIKFFNLPTFLKKMSLFRIIFKNSLCPFSF